MQNIDNEKIYQYYIVENHSRQESASIFGISESKLKKICSDNGWKKDRKLHNQNIGKSKIYKFDRVNELKQLYIDENKTRKEVCERLGLSLAVFKRICRENSIEKTDENRIFNTNKTISEKYGESNFGKLTSREEIINKRKQTNLKKYGYVNPTQNKKIQEKMRLSNLRRSPNKSSIGLTIEEVNHIVSSKENFEKFVKDKDVHTTVQIAEMLGYGVSAIEQYIAFYNCRDLIDPTSSAPEQEVRLFIESLGIKTEHTRQIIPPYEIDIYCPDYKVGIEFNGTYWHSSLRKQKSYHEDKAKAAERAGIRLIQIYQYQWEDENLREILKSVLKITFGKVDSRIYARNCEVREITNEIAKPFNNKNHLQGHRNAAITYGLYHNNELVQLMSFSRHNKYEWEIIRGCPGSNNVVVGGVSKLFKHFIKNYNPNQVFSYCDFNTFDGKGYEAIGMKFIGYTGPDLRWIIDGDVKHRSPSHHKEYKENAEAVIWGAGSKKYLWTK